jgi:hypothetical protein
MYSLDRDFTVSGHIHSESLREHHQDFERMCGVYFCTIHADDPYMREEIIWLCEQQLQPHQKLHVEDQPPDKSLVRFETINDPRLQLFDDGTYLGVSDHVTLDVRVEISESRNGEHCFPRFYLRRVSPYIDPNDSTDWDSMPDNGYNF